MGGRHPEGHITGTRNTRMGETYRKQRRMEAPFEGGQGAEGGVAPHMNRWMVYFRGADKSLARPGRKQARKHVRDARDFNNIETQSIIIFFFCKAMRRRKFTPF